MKPTQRPPYCQFRRQYRTALAVMLVGLLLAPVAASARVPSATAAKRVTVKETIRAHLLSHHGGSSLSEAGTGSGTFNCPLSIRIDISYTSASINFTCRMSGGSFTGHGTTSYYASGHTAHFEGTLSVSSGTGRYAHASSNSLRIVGSLVRGSYALSATVGGGLKY